LPIRDYLTPIATASMQGRIEEGAGSVTTEALLREISDYCRRVGMAE